MIGRNGLTYPNIEYNNLYAPTTIFSGQKEQMKPSRYKIEDQKQYDNFYDNQVYNGLIDHFSTLFQSSKRKFYLSSFNESKFLRKVKTIADYDNGIMIYNLYSHNSFMNIQQLYGSVKIKFRSESTYISTFGKSGSKNVYNQLKSESDLEFALVSINSGESPDFHLIEEININHIQNIEENKWKKNLICGAIAGAVSRIITAPLERLKILYQINYKGSSKPPNILNGLKEIIKNDGITGLFRGNLINMMKSTPETSIRLACFEFFKHLYKKREGKNGSNNNTLTLFQLFVCGGISGLVSSFFVFPLDVLKTRFAVVNKGTYNSIVDAVVKISRNEGRIKPFFYGYQATFCSSLPNSGLNLMSYEILKTLANNYYNEKKKQSVPFPLYMIIGGISALFTSSLLYPWQLITSRIIMQGVNQKKKLGMIQIINDIRYYEGIKGFYKGFKPAMTKIIVGNGVAFYAFEVCKNCLDI